MFRNKDIYITNFDHKRLLEMLNSYISGTRKEFTAAINLSEEMKRAKKVDSKEISADYVTMNTVFEIEGIVKPDRKRFRLVFPNDADMENGKMSVLAPVGTAVLGYREGDVVKWKVPAGEKKFRINKVIYQPEAAGEYHL